MSLPDQNHLAEEDEHNLQKQTGRRPPQTSRFLERKLNDGAGQDSHAAESATNVVCRFYAKHGRCRFEDACKFSHVDNNKANDGRTEDDAPSAPVDSKQRRSGRRKTEFCQFFARHGFCRYGWSCRYIHGRKPPSRNFPGEPQLEKRAETKANSQDSAKAETPEELRDREIRQFLRRYPKAREVRDSDGTRRCNFVFEPTDPDWRFDVRQLNLVVTFPKNYPQECIGVTALDDEAVLPPLLVRDLNKAILEWLREKHDAEPEEGPRQLILRPFLRWLDRNLENLFIESLRKVKKIQLAEAAGLEFVPYETLAPKSEPSANSGSTGLTDCKDESRNQPAVYDVPEVDNGLPRLSEGSAEEYKELDESDRGVGSLKSEPDAGRQRAVEGCHVPPDESRRSEILSTDAPQVHSDQLDVPSRSGQRLADGGTNDQKQEAINGAVQTVLSNPKRGTEIKFRRLELGENVGTLECQKMALRVQCSRCRCTAEVVTPPRRRNVVVCGRCGKSVGVVFRPNLVHAFNSVLGFLDLTDCSVLDLMLPACVFATVCLRCDKQTQLDGIHYGQWKTTWCHSCNCKVTFLMESIKFQHLQPAGTHDPGKAFTIKAPKAVKNVRDPAIQEGKPLPNNGTCKHYKKSFRWLRFPCCGKAYPCDVCHEEQEGDHEMKYATRMICGHCAKEQPFSTDKPCVGCNSFTTKKATAHWEGGRGCRDRVKMSRDDSKKYSGTGKTISRKAQAGAPGKK